MIVFVPAQACRGEDQHRRGESFHRPVHGAPRGDQQSGFCGRARCCRRASAGTSWPRWPSTGPPSWRTRWPPTACSCTEAGVSLFIWNLWGWSCCRESEVACSSCVFTHRLHVGNPDCQGVRQRKSTGWSHPPKTLHCNKTPEGYVLSPEYIHKTLNHKT